MSKTELERIPVPPFCVVRKHQGVLWRWVRLWGQRVVIMVLESILDLMSAGGPRK